MIDYDFGDVVLVPFPFTDQTSVKQRPAVVVSSKKYNLERPDIVLMPATSQRDASVYFGEVALTAWKEAGFLRPYRVLGRIILQNLLDPHQGSYWYSLLAPLGYKPP